MTAYLGGVRWYLRGVRVLGRGEVVSERVRVLGSGEVVSERDRVLGSGVGTHEEPTVNM